MKLHEHTITIDRLQAKARAATSLQNDFLLFQDRPLIEFATGQFLCIDPGFLLEKAGRAFYWTLHLRTRSERRVHLLGYWASVVDQYAQWLFAQGCEGRGQVIQSPRFSDGAEACDVMVQEGTRIILFEVKASTLTAQAKYGFDSALLKEELLLKAIEGEEGHRKGVAQLRHTISRFQNGDPIEGINNRPITMIYPVLVFLDNSFTSPYLGSIYREHFERATLKRRPTVCPLYAITVNDVEDILPHTDRHGLADIFDDHYRNNRTPSGDLAHGSLSHGRIPLLIGEPPGKDVVRKRFQQFANDLILRIFSTAATPDEPA